MPAWLFGLLIKPFIALAFMAIFWVMYQIPKLVLRRWPWVVRILYGDFFTELAAWRLDRERRRCLSSAIGSDKRL